MEVGQATISAVAPKEKKSRKMIHVAHATYVHLGDKAQMGRKCYIFMK
jgi:hypothetical protein